MTPSINARTIPMCHPMMIRRFIPHGGMGFFGGVFVLDGFDVEDVGIAESRYAGDEDVVDCSNRIFQITTAMMMADKPLHYAAFPIRRWRNLVEDITAVPMIAIACPSKDTPLLYIGNPIQLDRDEDGTIHVRRLSEFVIKSGMELGY